MSRNNAKSTISELEFQMEQLRQEKTAAQGEIKTLQDNMSELQIQVTKNKQTSEFSLGNKYTYMVEIQAGLNHMTLSVM